MKSPAGGGEVQALPDAQADFLGDLPQALAHKVREPYEG